MKTRLLLIAFVFFAIEGCSQKQEHRLSSLNDTASLKKYCGNWLNFSKSGFILIDLNDIHNIMIYEYHKNEIKSGETNTSINNLFYKSKGFINSYHDNGISIQTDKYRYDYILRNDTLFLWTELGLEEGLIKINSINR
jgi:hypothetical protein